VNLRIRLILRWLVGIYLVALHVFAGFFGVRYFYPEFFVFRVLPIENIRDPLSSTPAPTPMPIPSEFVEDLPTPQPPAVPDLSNAPQDKLLIPVKGVRRDQLQDTYASARSGGRTHDAIDIMAPLGTPVLAASDGEILKFFDSEAGGITIYQLSADKRYIFYYAHLQRRQSGINEHDQVKRGDVIAYVGDTGNAGAGNFHLHFAIAIPTDPKRFWGGPYINPYLLLREGIEAP
jgi:peptidoglycan LD-endopeptidase LytH